MILPARFLPSGLAAFVLCCALSTASAQQKFHAGKIVFDNLGDFTRAQLMDAAGVHVGDTFTADDLGAAAQRMSDTGYFNNVGATLDGAVDNVTVKFSVVPATHSELLHAGYENFVWLTPDEIATAVRAKVPLYQGYVPETGDAAEKIESVLKELLSAKGVQANIRHTTIEPSLFHPERVVEYAVSRPMIRVVNVHLRGVKTELVPYVQKAVNTTANKPYNDGLEGQSTATTILLPLLDAGYVTAALEGLTLTPTTADSLVNVDVAATLNAGEVFHVDQLSYAGSPLMNAEAFNSGAKLHAGDVASHAALMETLAPLDLAYRKQGYMDVVVHADPKLDAAAHTVDYVVTVTPGEQYRIHTLTVSGLDADAKARADFDRGFLLKVGDLYNPDYLEHFLKNNTALQALNGYAGGFKATADPAAHTVDVDMRFFKAGGR